LIPNASVFRIATMVITMVAGTAVIMWMGELITDRGVGNGMSVMIFTQVIAVIPGELLTIWQTKGTFTELLALVVVACIVGFVVCRLTAPGPLYLGVVAMFPLVALGVIGVGQQFPFSGVSLLIMVGVGLDTVKQIESQLQQRNYEGFLR